MHIDWWTLALQTINLLVLVWILSRFLFRPIADVIRQRQAAADALLEKAEAERARAEEEEERAEHDKQEAEKARGKVLQTAAKEAEVEKQQILEQARAEADKLRAAAKAEVEKAREAEQQRANRQASGLAINIARKLFERLPDGAKVDGFVSGLAESIAALPERARNEIGASEGAVNLVAARELSTAELTTCKVAISKALGRDVAIGVKSDPALIAGLEIETPHTIVRNSFRADLDQITSELAGHDQV